VILRQVGVGDAFIVSGHGHQLIFIEPTIEGTTGLAQQLFGNLIHIDEVPTLQQDTICYVLDKGGTHTFLVPDFAAEPFALNNQIYIADHIRSSGETFEHALMSDNHLYNSYYRLTSSGWSSLGASEEKIVNAAVQSGMADDLTNFRGNPSEKKGWIFASAESGHGEVIGDETAYTIKIPATAINPTGYELRRTDVVGRNSFTARFELRPYPSDEPYLLLYDESPQWTPVSYQTYMRFLHRP
jgi:hypothetical protein